VIAVSFHCVKLLLVYLSDTDVVPCLVAGRVTPGTGGVVQLPVAGVAARGECHLVARDARTALCGMFLVALVLEGEAALHPTRFTHRTVIAGEVPPASAPGAGGRPPGVVDRGRRWFCCRFRFGPWFGPCRSGGLWFRLCGS